MSPPNRSGFSPARSRVWLLALVDNPSRNDDFRAIRRSEANAERLVATAKSYAAEAGRQPAAQSITRAI
jgi:hypothetical protein